MARQREGTWPKIIRAEELLASIRAEVDTYGEGRPYRVVGDFDDDGRGCTAWVELEEPPSIRLSVLIGEFAYNLRSALDHTADWLVRRANGQPTENTTFPIRDSCLNRKGTKPLPLTIEGGVSMPAMAVIESLQPYHLRPHQMYHPLSLLRRISNTDKHRNLIVTASVVINAQVMLKVGGARFVQWVQGLFEHGAPLAHFPFAVPVDPIAREEVEMYTAAETLVTFGEPEPPLQGGVIRMLEGILSYVRDDVVRELERAESARP